jgi:hypothetical protein
VEKAGQPESKKLFSFFVSNFRYTRCARTPISTWNMRLTTHGRPMRRIEHSRRYNNVVRFLCYQFIVGDIVYRILDIYEASSAVNGRQPEIRDFQYSYFPTAFKESCCSYPTHPTSVMSRMNGVCNCKFYSIVGPVLLSISRIPLSLGQIYYGVTTYKTLHIFRWFW